MAFGLSAPGLFSLVSLDVADRRHELALRIALGASRERIVRSVLVSIATPTMAGVLLGVNVAATGSRALRALMFGVDVLDAATYGIAVSLIACVTTLAAYVPVRRAALADPLTLLRRG